MPVGAIIGSTVVGVGGSMIAANKEAKAADKATKTQLEMYQQTREDLTPYNKTGQAATYSLAKLYGLPGADGTTSEPDYSGFENSPDYKFARDEGIKALDASASAKGSLLSGGMMKDLTEYGAGIASQNYGNYVNRLMDLARLGEAAGAQTGTAGANAATGVANTQLRAGEAQASGVVGAVNSVNAGTTNYLRNYNQQQGYNTAYIGSQAIPATSAAQLY